MGASHVHAHHVDGGISSGAPRGGPQLNEGNLDASSAGGARAPEELDAESRPAGRVVEVFSPLSSRPAGLLSPHPHINALLGARYRWLPAHHLLTHDGQRWDSGGGEVSTVALRATTADREVSRLNWRFSASRTLNQSGPTCLISLRVSGNELAILRGARKTLRDVCNRKSSKVYLMGLLARDEAAADAVMNEFGYRRVEHYSSRDRDSTGEQPLEIRRRKVIEFAGGIVIS